VTRFERALPATCEWLAERVAGRDWREALPGAAALYGSLFDYAKEDEVVRGLIDGGA
jgi:hypothetical protein